MLAVTSCVLALECSNCSSDQFLFFFVKETKLQLNSHRSRTHRGLLGERKVVWTTFLWCFHQAPHLLQTGAASSLSFQQKKLVNFDLCSQPPDLTCCLPIGWVSLPVFSLSLSLSLFPPLPFLPLCVSLQVAITSVLRELFRARCPLPAPVAFLKLLPFKQFLGYNSIAV